jgi:ribosome recycling factor
MIKDVMSKARQSMDGAIDALKRELTRVRTGRASVSLLDEVRVDYYGTPTPLNQVGTLAVPEARMITVQPWEKNLLPEIEKAIFKSDLGLTPSSDGELIRIAIPALTEERRKEMVKLVKGKSEDAKISIRGARRDGNDALKKLEKEKEITEDDLKRSEKEMQDLTDKYVKKCDEIVAEKEQELMEV